MYAHVVGGTDGKNLVDAETVKLAASLMVGLLLTFVDYPEHFFAGLPEQINDLIVVWMRTMQSIKNCKD